MEEIIKLITFENVTKKYGGETVVNGFSYTVGESVAILGDHKSGKTAIVELIAGITAPSRGRVTVDGCSAISGEVAEKVGYMPVGCPIDASMTAAEALGFMAELRGLNDVDVELALDEADLNNKSADCVVKMLSELDRKRAALAYALLGSPEYLVLDQPILGLNEADEKEMLELLDSLKDKYTIIYTSDTVDDARSLCPQVALISAGKLVASGDFDSVLYPDESLINFKARVRGDKDTVKELLESTEKITKYKVSVTSTGTAILDFTAVGGEYVEAEIRELFTQAGIKVLEIKKADSAADKVLSALFDRQEEKEEKRKAERENEAEPIKLTSDLVESVLHESDETEEDDDGDDESESEETESITRHEDQGNAYRVKLTAEFIAEAFRESEDDSDGEDDGE